jgi:EpsI family protein
MTIEPKRAAVLLAVVTLGMSLVFALPKGENVQPLGVVDMKDVPEYVGAWRGEDMEVTEKEKKTLGEDTGFARKSYTTLGSYRGKKATLDSSATHILLSVVLSGQDMNTSIHRAERCLPTQGWNITDKREVPISLPGRGSFTATRLYNTKIVKNDAGQTAQARMLSYYWFVGHTDITGSHFARTFIDMKDRLLSGYNQRWAYVTVTANIPQSRDPAQQASVDATVDEMIREYIVSFMPKVAKETVQFH